KSIAYHKKGNKYNVLASLFKGLERHMMKSDGIYSGKLNNVAPQGIPSQSSYFGSKLEVRAPIDGSLRSNYMAGECAHTKKEMNPWWRVDLKSKMVIQSVAITNRLECCRERINGAELRVGDSKENGGIGNPRCGVVNRMNYGETLSFDCKGMEGQYVTITLPNREYLTLCEMQVCWPANPDLL
uniref:Fucolectin tachylectin-4 pentraxin-1 domain-containing protein n=1 Tax=Leptobrachium leishanense TaxID=445787 RepID=A0A8C5QUD9_9ANUR